MAAALATDYMNHGVRFSETHAGNHVCKKEGAPLLVAKFSGVRNRVAPEVTALSRSPRQRWK
jgi:hypothetical protein